MNVHNYKVGDTVKIVSSKYRFQWYNAKVGQEYKVSFVDTPSRGRGMFSKLGEHWFDEYWMNYKKITVQDGNGGTKKISTLREFVEYKNGDVSLIVEKRNGEE